MKPIRVLIVEDSAFTRKAISIMLRGDPELAVAGEARDGEEALSLAQSLLPDVITMDLDMPRLDGLASIAELRRRGLKTPVLVVSSLAQEGAEPVIKALAAGAADVIPKPDGEGGLGVEAIERELRAKIRAVSGRVTVTADPGLPGSAAPAQSRAPIKLVCVGASTGGVEALSVFLSGLAGTFPVPVVVAQHLPAVFTPLFAKRLGRVSALETRIIEDGEVLDGLRGLFVAPGQQNVRLLRGGPGLVARLSPGAPGQAAPSADVLMESAAEALGGRHVLGILLTGMGEDGARGAARIHREGGRVYVQDSATSVVWGMPGSAVRAGAVHAVLPLGQLARAVTETLA
jgi:two-component system chemotaxis response regulator CheB